MSAVETTRANLDAQGRRVVEALGGSWSSGRGTCRCPAHADRNPSLSVRVGSKSLLFHCFAGCDTTDVLRELRRSGALEGKIWTCDDVSAASPPDLGAIVDRLWASSRAVTGTLAERYLASRGLCATGSQLRFHPRVQLGPRREATYHPALLAAVRDDSGLVAVHRTFLDREGRGLAHFENAKRMLGTPGAGAVRLAPPDRVLGLAEGVENALAAMRLHGIPVWAALGNERFGTITIPTKVERLVIVADRDAGGRRAAELAYARKPRAGLTIGGMWPPEPHNDWNEVLLASARWRRPIPRSSWQWCEPAAGHRQAASGGIGFERLGDPLPARR